MSEQDNNFDNKVNILSELWMGYRFEPEFSDFVDYNDLGLPLSFLVSEQLVKPTERARAMVEESYSLLLAALEKPDGDYESLDDLLVG